MSELPWRVAVIDSGLDPHSAIRVTAVCRFVDAGTRVTRVEPTADPSGHGTTVAMIIAGAARPVEFLIAQVMNAGGRTTAATVATAVHWALAERARLLQLSLGLSHDRSVLALAIEAAVAAGVVVVASIPARGRASYPAQYPGVIRATGDARCGPDEVSSLGTPAADFGACAVCEIRPGHRARGASIGAAHLARFIVSHIAPAAIPAEVCAELDRLATYRGRERRSG